MNTIAKKQRDRERHLRGIGVEFQCVGCGVAFIPKAWDRTKYHSRECRFEHQKRLASERVQVDSPPKTRTCRICGIDGKRVVCGGECQKEDTRRQARRWCYEHESPPVVPCDMCGVEVVRRRGEVWITKGKRCAECRRKAKKAQRQIGKARRTHRKNGHPIRRAETIIEEGVFCSALWVCGICGETVDHRCRAGDMLSAEMDHVRPLSRGGTHTRDNVQCTHRICNLAKHDYSQDETKRAINMLREFTGKTLKEMACPPGRA